MSRSNGYTALVNWIEEKGSNWYVLFSAETMRNALGCRRYGNSLDDARIVGFYLCVANEAFQDWIKVAETELREYVSLDTDRFREESIVLFSRIHKSEFERLSKLLSLLPKNLQPYPERMASLISGLEFEWLAEEAARNEKIAAYRAQCAAKREALAQGEVEMKTYAV